MVTIRRVPQLKNFVPLMQFDLNLGGRKSRLARVGDIDDLRRIAKRRTPAGPFNYVDGGAQDEYTYRGNREAFRN